MSTLHRSLNLLTAFQQNFFVLTTPERFENAKIASHYGFMFEQNLVMEITHYRVMIIFQKLPFQCAETSPVSSSLKSVFEKQFSVCGTVGLVRTVCLTVEMKLCSVERVLVFKLVPESLVPLKPSEIETKKSWFSGLFSKGAISKLLFTSVSKRVLVHNLSYWNGYLVQS